MYMYIYIVYIIKAECSFACLSVCLCVRVSVCPAITPERLQLRRPNSVESWTPPLARFLR